MAVQRFNTFVFMYLLDVDIIINYIIVVIIII